MPPLLSGVRMLSFDLPPRPAARGELKADPQTLNSLDFEDPALAGVKPGLGWK